MSDIIKRYYAKHGANTRAGNRMKYQIPYLINHFKGKSVADACKVEGITSFCTAMKEKKHSASYINNTLTILKAAVNYAWKSGELDRQIYIPMLKTERAEPKGRPLKPDEWRALLASASPHVEAMIMLGLGTGARPEAICQLTWDRVDLENGLIDFDVPERERTQKHRPVVKIPPTLKEWLHGKQSKGPVVSFRGQPIHRYHGAWIRARNDAGVAGATAYSCRHTVARWCRAQGVPAWQVAAQLGHSAGGRLTITERYASYSPDYLDAPCAAIEKLLQAVQRAETVSEAA